MWPLSVKRISVLAQLLIFVGLLLVQCFPLFWKITFPAAYWIKQAIMYVAWLGLFYLTLLVLLRYLLFRSRSGFFFLVIVLIIPAILYLSHFIDGQLNLQEIMNRHFKMKADQIRPEQHLLADFATVIITLLVIGSSTVIGVGQKLRAESQLRDTLEKQKISSELSFLKSQINPHFFFNILNSIYALTRPDNPAARDAIYNLSHLMRYVLYDTKNNLTSLHKEVAFVEDYLKLMELRITPNVQVIFDKPQTLKDVNVAPMLFLPFIENAYKHGISSIHPSYIYIGIKQDDGALQIEVRNSVFDTQPLDKEESNGIGLVNTRRRLDLIYPGRYSLVTREDATLKEYYICLILNLP
jgi:two-component system LytT family sensor kinase